jgi:hypothetical protein
MDFAFIVGPQRKRSDHRYRAWPARAVAALREDKEESSFSEEKEAKRLLSI